MSPSGLVILVVELRLGFAHQAKAFGLAHQSRAGLFIQWHQSKSLSIGALKFVVVGLNRSLFEQARFRSWNQSKSVSREPQLVG